jgi:hypothetical protein
MPNRSSKTKRQETDPNVRAFMTVLRATGQFSEQTEPEKNAAAVALGRLGGLKGGKARAKKLSASKRADIARRAARARWGNVAKRARKA